MKLSLCITTYNRYEMTIESFAKVIDDPRIDDIVIMDDCSTDGSGIMLANMFTRHPKVRVFLQAENRGMSKNKHDAISFANNNFAVILDSDNSIDTDYIDAIHAEEPKRSNEVILSPDFAYPNFDFRKYSGKYIHKGNVKSFMGDPMFRCFLNCCNYCVPKNTYLKTYQYDQSVKETDTIAFNYEWLKAGYLFYIIPNCKYHHLVHKDSGFIKNIDYNMIKAKEFENKIMQL